MTETSTKPYLIRALHEWCSDNGYTPFLSVAVDEHTIVPREHVRDGIITLNIGTLATHKLELGNDYVEFQARFGGVARQISVPIASVRAIYARETGQGMAFEPTEADRMSTPTSAAPALAVADAPAVSDTDTPVPAEPAPAATDERPALTAVPDTGTQAPEDDTPPPNGSDNGGARPRLTVIK